MLPCVDSEQLEEESQSGKGSSIKDIHTGRGELSQMRTREREGSMTYRCPHSQQGCNF